jgi:hypothetical protein
MTTIRDITDAINAALVKALPAAAAHIDACPEGFSRPAYLIALKSVSRSSVNKSTQSVLASIQITYFGEMDDKGVCDRDELHDAQQTIANIFAGGCFAVGDRHLEVAAAGADGQEGSTAVAATFSFFDDRGITAETLPVMGTVATTVKEV